MPQKNIIPFCGRPLIEWTISFALHSKIFTGVYVSTDDNIIAEISSKAGATVIDRPDSLATDLSSTAEVAHHAYLYLSEPLSFDWMCILQPTSPLRPEFLMPEAIVQIPKLNQDDSIITVTACDVYKHLGIQTTPDLTMGPQLQKCVVWFSTLSHQS